MTEYPDRNWSDPPRCETELEFPLTARQEAAVLWLLAAGDLWAGGENKSVHSDWWCNRNNKEEYRKIGVKDPWDMPSRFVRWLLRGGPVNGK